MPDRARSADWAEIRSVLTGDNPRDIVNRLVEQIRQNRADQNSGERNTLPPRANQVRAYAEMSEGEHVPTIAKKRGKTREFRLPPEITIEFVFSFLTSALSGASRTSFPCWRLRVRGSEKHRNLPYFLFRKRIAESRHSRQPNPILYLPKCFPYRIVGMKFVGRAASQELATEAS